ncbi:hypothetical protein ABH935_009558 [Catenulispora sp. GAS73]
MPQERVRPSVEVMGQALTPHGAHAATALCGIEGNCLRECVLHAVQMVLKGSVACDFYTDDLLDGTKV